VTDPELRASHEDRDRVAELSRDLPAVGGAGAAGQAKDTSTIERQGGNDKREGTGHLRARQRRRASRRRA
jgi:hypothetical protein